MRTEFLLPKYRLGSPICLIVPHGPDEAGTLEIARLVQKRLDCYAVLNTGYYRSATLDVGDDFANLNRKSHFLDPVVYQEYIEPIKLSRMYSWTARSDELVPPMNYIILHGMGHDRQFGDNVILGCGLNEKTDEVNGIRNPKHPTNTADPRFVSKFQQLLSKDMTNVSVAPFDHRFAAKSKSNLCWYLANGASKIRYLLPARVDPYLQSRFYTSSPLQAVQVEISKNFRSSSPFIEQFARDFSQTLDELIDFDFNLYCMKKFVLAKV